MTYAKAQDNLRQIRTTYGGALQIDACDADIAAMNGLIRQGVRVGNEHLSRDPHLYELIPKPWGQEYRVYADDFLDVWQLQIDAGQGTSMHAHPRKTTHLLCLAGQGTTTTLIDTIQLRPGSILRIGRGAFHSTHNADESEPLMLIEVETPRNKYDLVRLRDGYHRAGTAYERTSSELRMRQRRIAFLPNARMRRTSPCGKYNFDIHAGMDVHYRRRSVGPFLIPLGVRELVTDQMAILTNRVEDDRPPNLDSYYLGISQAT